MKVKCKSYSATSEGSIFLGDTSSIITLDIDGVEESTKVALTTELLEDGFMCNELDPLHNIIKKLRDILFTNNNINSMKDATTSHLLLNINIDRMREAYKMLEYEV